VVTKKNTGCGVVQVKLGITTTYDKNRDAPHGVRNLFGILVNKVVTGLLQTNPGVAAA
jgi:hypothetical protein